MSQQIIDHYRIFAKKSLGQNFLVDDNITTSISNSINIMWSNVVEVWPGYWVLTEKLLNKKPKSLHLVELDRDMIEILEDRKSLWELECDEIDFKIHNIDVLEFTPDFNSYLVVANIPYYITSPILRHFLYDIKNSPEQMLILMQKDVGDKILWKWRNKSSVLSLMIEKKCKIEERILVPKESFVPVPKVESSVLYFELHNTYDSIDDRGFLELIKIWFRSPRKKLLNNLVSGGIDKVVINDFLCHYRHSENLRWEDLTIEQWIELLHFIDSKE